MLTSGCCPPCRIGPLAAAPGLTPTGGDTEVQGLEGGREGVVPEGAPLLAEFPVDVELVSGGELLDVLESVHVRLARPAAVFLRRLQAQATFYSPRTLHPCN